MPIVARIVIATCLLTVFAGANAQSGSTTGDLAGSRPNAGGEPEAITVRLGLLDIAEINDREQVFMADIFVQVEWQDHRLAVDGDTGGELRTFPLDGIWNPRLTIINSRGLDRIPYFANHYQLVESGEVRFFVHRDARDRIRDPRARFLPPLGTLKR